MPRALSVFVYSTIEKLHYSAVIGYGGSGLAYNLTVSLGIEMDFISRDRLEELNHDLRFGGTLIPTPEVMRQTAAKLTGRIDAGFENRKTGFISAAAGRFTFSASDIVSGEPKAVSIVTFTIKYRVTVGIIRPAALDQSRLKL